MKINNLLLIVLVLTTQTISFNAADGVLSNQQQAVLEADQEILQLASHFESFRYNFLMLVARSKELACFEVSLQQTPWLVPALAMLTDEFREYSEHCFKDIEQINKILGKPTYATHERVLLSFSLGALIAAIQESRSAVEGQQFGSATEALCRVEAETFGPLWQVLKRMRREGSSSRDQLLPDSMIIGAAAAHTPLHFDTTGLDQGLVRSTLSSMTFGWIRPSVNVCVSSGLESSKSIGQKDRHWQQKINRFAQTACDQSRQAQLEQLSQLIGKRTEGDAIGMHSAVAIEKSPFTIKAKVTYGLLKVLSVATRDVGRVVHGVTNYAEKISPYAMDATARLVLEPPSRLYKGARSRAIRCFEALCRTSMENGWMGDLAQTVLGFAEEFGYLSPNEVINYRIRSAGDQRSKKTILSGITRFSTRFLDALELFYERNPMARTIAKKCILPTVHGSRIVLENVGIPAGLYLLSQYINQEGVAGLICLNPYLLIAAGGNPVSYFLAREAGIGLLTLGEGLNKGADNRLSQANLASKRIFNALQQQRDIRMNRLFEMIRTNTSNELSVPLRSDDEVVHECMAYQAISAQCNESEHTSFGVRCQELLSSLAEAFWNAGDATAFMLPR